MNVTAGKGIADRTIRLAMIGCLLFGALDGCKGRMEQIFILRNDNASPKAIATCFIKILPPPGEALTDYNQKTVLLSFRNAKDDILFKKEIDLSAAKIKPKIDWSDYPKIRILLQSDSQDSVYFVTLPGGDQPIPNQSASRRETEPEAPGKKAVTPSSHVSD